MNTEPTARTTPAASTATVRPATADVTARQVRHWAHVVTRTSIDYYYGYIMITYIVQTCMTG